MRKQANGVFYELSEPMHDALDMLEANGVLFAGAGNKTARKEKSRVSSAGLVSVHASTIKALVARGYCTLHTSPDGGLMARKK